MKQIFLKAWLILACLLVGVGESVAETYKLQQVTSVSAGEKYVFVQDTHAFGSTVSSSALQTVEGYKTTGLAGTEAYVWTLETATGGFYMKNVSLTSNPYLNNSSSTNVSFGSASSVWTFDFTDTDAVLIQNKSNSNRFLGYTTATSYVYKAYAAQNLDTYSHAIKVYKLVEETGGDPTKTTPTLSFAAPTYEATIGETFTAPELMNPDGVAVTYASSQASVATVDASSGVVTLVAPGETTITASFAGNDTYNAASARYELNVAAVYTVAWSVNGEVIKSESVREGAAVTAPADPEAINGKVFTGWIETATVEGATPAYVTPSETATKNVTYYAVFATRAGDGVVTYTKLTSNIFDEEVEYVLAAEESSSSTTLHYFSSYATTTANESWGVTSTDADDAIIFTLSGTADALVAQDASGNCIQALASGKFRMSSSSTTLKLNSNGTIYNPSSTSYNLRYNHNSGSGGFRWYSSATGTSAYFYKKNDGYTYSDYCTILTLPVTFKEAGLGYSTLYSDKALEIPEGVEAYALTKNETAGYLTPTQIEEVIPANTGVMLVTENSGWEEGAKTYHFAYTTTENTVSTDLLGVTEETDASGNEYVLSVVEGQVGFYKFEGAKLAANKAYYVSDSAVRGFYVDFTGEQTTGIYKNENENENGNRVAFDLTGRRINVSAKGISIMAGKKVIR